MTSPGSSLTSRVALASQASGGGRPSTSLALANSDLSDSQIAQVGGFVDSMGTSLVARMARVSGAKTMFSAKERAQLDSLDEKYDDVDASGAEGKDEPRNWLEQAMDWTSEKLTNTGEALVDALDPALWLFEQGMDTVKLPWRMLSSGLDAGNDDEIAQQMEAQGYDTGSAWDTIQFHYHQGDSLFHDLSGIRDVYGDEAVDLAMDYYADPEAFADRRLHDKDFEAKASRILNSDEWADVAERVDRKHISPGRDIANLLLTEDQSQTAAFTAISGTLDAVYTLALDPTLILGKGIRLARAIDATTGATNVTGLSRFGISRHLATGIDKATKGYYRQGIQNTLDVDGMRTLLAVDETTGQAKHQVGKHLKRFLDDATELRRLHAAGEDVAYQAHHAGMTRRHSGLMPLLDEVNGRRVIPETGPAKRARGVDGEDLGYTVDDLVNSTSSEELRRMAREGHPGVLGSLAAEARTAGIAPSARLGGHEVDEAGEVVKSAEQVAAATPPATPGRYADDELTSRTVAGDHSIRHQRTAPDTTPTPPPGQATPEGVLNDVNGHGWHVQEGKAIERLDDFAEYLASTAGLLRLGNGHAAQTNIIMPGRMTWRAQLSAKVRAARVRREGEKFDDVVQEVDHSRLHRNVPIKEEAELSDAVEQLDAGLLTDTEVRGQVLRNLLTTGKADASVAAGTGRRVATTNGLAATARKSRAKWDQRARRLTTMLPTVQHLDLNSSAHAEQVRRFARLYLSRTEADRLSAMWTMGDAAARRDIAKGMLDQTYHASGLSASDQGAAFWKRYKADQELAEKQRYGYEKNDLVQTDRGPVHAALHLSQLNDRVMLPSFRELSYIASKYNAASYFQRKVGARFLSDTMDASMTAIKMGWITSPAGGLRNAIDELAGIGLRGMGADQLRYRSLYTQATKKDRAGIRRTARDYQKLVREHGRERAEEILGARVKTADEAAVARGATTAERAEARRAAALETRLKHRIPLWARGTFDTVNDAVFGVLLGKLVSARGVEGALRDKKDLEILRELVELQKAGLTHRTIADTHYADDMAGITDDAGAHELARSGIASTQIRYKNKGWEQVEVDGGAGHDAWSSTLAMKFSDPADPSHVALRTLWETKGDALAAQQAVRSYMDSPRVKHFRDQATILKWTKEGKPVKTPEQASQVLDDYSQRLVADVLGAVKGKGGSRPSQDLVDAARRWRSETERAKHGDLATKREVDQADLDRAAEEALAKLTAARQERDAFLEGKRTGSKADKEQATLDRLTAKVEDLKGRRDRISGKAHPDDAVRAGAVRDRDKLLAELARAETKLDKARAARDRIVHPKPDDVDKAAPGTKARKPGKPKPETVERLRAAVREAEKEHRRLKARTSKAQAHHDEVHGQKKSTPEELLAIREKVRAAQSELTAAKKRLTRVSTTLDETGGRVTPEEIEEAKAAVQAAEKAHRVAASKARNNGRKLQRNSQVEATYEFDGHVTDSLIQKYLREGKGVEPRPGEWAEGQIHPELAEMLLRGEIPDRSFLAALPEEYKPRYAIKQQFAPIMPTGVVERMAGNWTEFLAKGYKKVVTDQAQAITRNPLFASKYVTARKQVADYENHLLDMGWTKEAADGVARRLAQAHAEQEVIKHIDNPMVASQFSVLARNVWVFERATEDALRRWGRIIRDDPTVIHKAQLGVHAGTSAGILHQDEDGNLTFTYPGSGAIISALHKVSAAMGLSSQVNIPVIPDLSSRLTFVNPALDNPLGFSATPVISVPYKWIAAQFGADYPLLVSSMDKVINGEMGAAREWYEQLLPTPVARIVNGAIRTDPGSRFGQAYMQAVANMEAAGALDDLNGADPGKLNEFHSALQAQIRNNMVMSAMFGLFAPAAPGLPENTVGGNVEDLPPVDRDNYGNDEAYEAALAHREKLLAQGEAGAADWTWHKQGLESLKAEARKVFAELPYEEAMEWWTRNHPGELVYAQSGASSTTRMSDGSDGASAPASLTAAGWMQDNFDFLKDHPGIGTYFIPQGKAGTEGGEFSDVAYRAQIELGIREKKDLREFLNGIIVARGESIYYDTKDDYDEALTRARATGDKGMVERLESEWAGEKALIYGANPLLAAKNAGYAENAELRSQQQAQLVELMKDPKSYRALGQQALGVQDLMDAYGQYQRATQQIEGERSRKAVQTRSQIKRNYEDAVATVTQAYPGLADLARGLFRIPA